MEARELMHGDLVLYGGHVCRFVIDANTAYLQRLSDGTQYLPCACQEAEAIKLSEEILKANGWRITKGNPSQGTMTRGFLVDVGFVYFFDDRIEFEIGSHIRVRGIFDCINELQHAYRLCGLNDLANNFKV